MNLYINIVHTQLKYNWLDDWHEIEVCSKYKDTWHQIILYLK